MSGLLHDLLLIVRVAVISGGDWPQFEKQLLSNLPHDKTLANLSLLPTCGTKFYQYDSAAWKRIYSEDLTAEERDKLLSALKKAISSADFKTDKLWGEQIEDRGSQITFSALGQHAPLEEKDKWDPDISKRKKIKAVLDSLIPEFSVRIGGSTSIDITKPGIDKAYGIRKLRDLLSVSLKEMIYIGDALYIGGNDYPAKEAGVDCIPVKDTNETKRVIQTIIACLSAFEMNDPFILLMDDHLDIGDRPVGGPHPHAGFETVTLILDGAIFDRDEGGTLNAGEVQWMTAGSGIIHSEDVRTKGKVRLLQLWLTLPKNERWIAPEFQTINFDEVPVRRENGAEIRVYSGASAGLQSGTRNHVPVTMVEINLEPHSSAELDIAASYNGFAFVIDGSVRIGDTELNTGQVGWLDRSTDVGTSVLRVVAGESGARLVLYAGQPQRDPIVSYGPFIGDSKQDIARLFAEYQSGRLPRLSELKKQQV